LSRWRDIKQGKVSKENKREKPTPKISPLHVRFKAFITDTFLILMPIMYIVFYAIMGSREGFKEHMLQGWIYILVPQIIIVTLFLYFKNQTPGYKAYNIKLVTIKMQEPSFFQVFARTILFSICTFLIIPLFYPFFQKDKLSIHDLITKTIPLQIDE